MTTNATARIEPLVRTATQRRYSRDFLKTWPDNEFWDTLAVGEWQQSPGSYVVAEEDVLAYNRALGETHPLYVDPDYARVHAPRGTVLVHPVFATALIFWVFPAEGAGVVDSYPRRAQPVPADRYPRARQCRRQADHAAGELREVVAPRQGLHHLPREVQ